MIIRTTFIQRQTSLNLSSHFSNLHKNKLVEHINKQTMDAEQYHND